MPSSVPVAIELSDDEREQLEAWTRRRTSAQALALRSRIVLAAAEGMSNSRAAELQALGCEVLALPLVEGRPAVTDLLAELGRRRLTNVLVEGGAAVLGSFFDAGAIDEVHVFIAPRLAGGTEARTPIAGLGVERIADALALTDWRVEQIEGDVLLRGHRK